MARTPLSSRRPAHLRGPAATLLTLGLLLVSGRARADDVTVHLTKEQALEKVFPGCDRVLELRYILSRDETRRIEKLSASKLDEGGFFIFTGFRGDEIRGYAVIVSQIGKVMPITHIVGVSPEGVVGTVAVMIYRESHGDEVADVRFMEQYRGRSLDDKIRIDRDIINIAGATLSGHAICRGVRKSLGVVRAVMLDRDAEQRRRLLAAAADVTPAALTARGTGEARGTISPEEAGSRFPGSGGADTGTVGHVRLERQIMGTICSLEAYADDLSDAALAAAAEAALDEVARWDGVLSDWREDTPLARLNAGPVGVPVAVEDDLLDWLTDARRWWRATSGAFDPGVGTLVAAWGLKTRTPARPSRAVLAAALRTAGMGSIHVDTAAGAVERTLAVQLDPGASGKGFALDRAGCVLAARGVERALLSFRSTLLALGPPPGQEGWVVPVVHDGSGTEVARVALVDGALSVSGGALRAHDDDGVARGHVIDPRSGVPVPADRLAWVRHPSASASDALATALLVEGALLAPVEGARGAVLEGPGRSAVSWPPSP